MDTVKKDCRIKKQLYLICIISFAVLYSVHTFVLEPIYTIAVSDVAVSSFLSNSLFYLCELTSLAAVYICYAVAIFGAHKFGSKNVKELILIFAVAAFSKYLGKTVVSWFYLGAIPSYWYIDLFDVIYFTGLELIQFLIIRAIISKTMSNIRDDQNQEMVFSRLYDKKNPMMRASLYAAIVELAVRLVLQASDDLMMIIMYGAPDKITTPILMAVSYLSTSVFAVLCYLIVVFTLSRLHKRYGREN